jgi:phage-related protein
LEFVGSSQDDLREFPRSVRIQAGYALQRAQEGGKHPDAIPMKGFGGAGVLEIRLQDDGNGFRVIYAVSIGVTIYVLHAFQKKSKSGIATSKRDLELIERRLKDAQDRAAGL